MFAKFKTGQPCSKIKFWTLITGSNQVLERLAWIETGKRWAIETVIDFEFRTI